MKQRHGAIKTWQNAQQLCGAMKHICDNDTSEFWLKFSHKMTVQFRCGQHNDLPPVCDLSDFGMGESDREFVIFFCAAKQRKGNYERNSL